MKSRRLFIKYISFLLGCFLLVFIVRMACTPHILSPRDYEEIMKEGVLNIVTDYSSTGYYVSGDSIAGFQHDMCKALEKHLGITIHIFLENNLSACIEGLNKQKYDIIARNIPITSENKEKLAFTDPIMLDRQVLVQRKATFNNNIPPIRNQIDLGKKTLYIPENSPGILRLHNLSEEIADTIYIKEEKQYAAEQLIYMVARGDIDFAVIARKTALDYLKDYPELDIDTDIGFTQIQSWALRKSSPELLDTVNHWIDSFKKTKEFSDIEKKSF